MHNLFVSYNFSSKNGMGFGDICVNFIFKPKLTKTLINGIRLQIKESLIKSTSDDVNIVIINIIELEND